MSIDKTIDSSPLITSRPVKEEYIGLPDTLKAPVSNEAQERISQIRDIIEVKNLKDFCRSAIDILTGDEDMLGECYEIFGIKANEADIQTRKQGFKDFSKHIEDIASYFISGNLDLQKVDFNKRKELFLKAILPENLRITYTAVCDPQRNILKSNQDMELRGKTAEELYRHEAERSRLTSQSDIEKANADSSRSEVYAAIQKNQHDNAMASSSTSESKKEESSNQKRKEVAQVFERFESSSKSDGDMKILESMKEKVSVDSKTGELRLMEPIRFGDAGELVLSPDKKGVILKGYGYEYTFSSFDGKSLEASLNKISSLNFMENAGLTAFTPQEMSSISLNLNKYFDITNGIPINLDKPEGFTQAEKHELLAVFKRLNVIPSYDPADLSKRIITKKEFLDNLRYKTDFYNGRGQLNMTLFDKNIKDMITRKSTQGKAA